MSAVLSPERVGRITGSRAPAILGLSPYATRDDVMRDMVREHFGDESEFIGNIATNHGQEHEAEALDLYEFTQGVTVTHRGGEQKFVRHPKIGFLGVTPDGWLGRKRLVEVKCPYRANYSHIDQRPDYWAQIQLQLACTWADWCDFVIWRHDGLIPPQRVVHDPEWLPSVLPELAGFHEEFLETISDPTLAERHRRPLVDVRTDPEWLLTAIEYREAKMAAAYYAGLMNESKDRLVKLAGEQGKSRGGGVLLTRSAPKGSIEWEKVARKFAPDIKDDDLEQFRGSGGKTTWTVRLST